MVFLFVVFGLCAVDGIGIKKTNFFCGKFQKLFENNNHACVVYLFVTFGLHQVCRTCSGIWAVLAAIVATLFLV